MKNYYAAYSEDELWLIKESRWARPLQNIRESQFALGNGYLGTRGVLEEIPYDAMPGTYISGVYDKMISQVDELVNLPNPFNFKFTVKGEKLDLVAMDSVEHSRMLNMKKGLLLRHTLYRSSKKLRFDYYSTRFVSMDNKNIGVMQITLVPLDESCEIDINSGIDVSVHNSGVLTEGNKKHFRLRELGQYKNAGYLAVDTLEKKHSVIYWAGFHYEINGKKTYAKHNIFRLKVPKNTPVTFTKIFYIKRFPADNKLELYKKDTFKAFHKAFHCGFDELLSRHIKAWERLWRRADIFIERAANLQQNLRFNIYHMIICAHADNGFSSIGARTLSGEGYRGHIFWDSEIFLFPFYLFTFPEAAKNMLLYRYKRINNARVLAAIERYKGAKFPWESADTGLDETPDWAKDLDGSIVKIHTHRMEHHITADIAYAVYRYYQATADDSFMAECGYEMLFATGRFWASRVSLDKKTKKYFINNVIGPDEFHIDVDNNAFTNLMAGFNLSVAYGMFQRLKKDSPRDYERLRKKLGLKESEARQWDKISRLIHVPANKDKVIEQFSGFFKLKHLPLPEVDENGIPQMPRDLKTIDMEKTQFVKQADVLMAIHTLCDMFSPEAKKANYDYYIQRTLHKSSLSPSIHAIVASYCRDLQTAYTLFNVALRMDLSNLYGNTREGIHGASLGGTWQTVIFGFGGVCIRKNKLYIDPMMPRTWRKMSFALSWRDALLRLELTNSTISIKAASKRLKELEIGIFNKTVKIKTNKSYDFKRKEAAPVAEYYY